MHFKNINALTYFTAVPLLVMSYHIFNFFETEPVIIRIGLALSFDVLVVISFYLLKDEYLIRQKKAKKAIWAVLMVLISFQLYVNIWAYWDLHPLRAILSGSIFPLVVGLLSYIGTLRQYQEEKIEARQQKKRRQQPTPAPSSTAGSGVNERPYAGDLVEKEVVITAHAAGSSIELFKGAKNWRSVKRWYKKLNNGEQP
tara:strand:- start:167798 stop:168394 length:597 start_codon:yes stop_codon:yes gene_type:complete